MNCPKCNYKLEEGECLAHGEYDVTEPCMVCDKCEEAFSFDEIKEEW
jgi:hypothetical protein